MLPKSFLIFVHSIFGRLHALPRLGFECFDLCYAHVIIHNQTTFYKLRLNTSWKLENHMGMLQY